MMRFLMLLVPVLALTACVEPMPVTPGVPPDTDHCGASGMQGLVGQPRSVLATMLLPAGSRVINPGDAVTMDFRPDRLNIEIGTDGRIAKIGCY